MKTKREYLTHFDIAGFTYCDGALAFGKLRPGVELTMKWEEDNRYDPQAIALYFQQIKLGYVPRRDNTILYKLLKMNVGRLVAVIQRVDATQRPEQQVGVVVHLTAK